MSDPGAQRVLLALGGNRVAEGHAITSLQAARGYELVGRCIDATALMRLAAEREPDYIFISDQLPDFSSDLLVQLTEMDAIPILLVDGDPDDDDGGGFQHLALRMNTSELSDGLGDLAERSERFVAAPPERMQREGPGQFVGPAPIIAVTSGKGGPGKTTVALGLAATLGAVLGAERVALADFDLRGGNVATWTGIDQSRGLMRARLPGEDSPELAAGDLEETQFNCLALAGLERGLAAYRLIPDDANRCLRALAANISEHGVVIVDCESNAQPALVLDQANLAILVCGSDALGVWNARGAASLLSGRGTPTILVINGSRSSSEGSREILETLGLAAELSVAGGQADVPVIVIPDDDRVLSLQRTGDAPTVGALGVAFRELAGEVLRYLARDEERWREPAAGFAPERGVFARMRTRPSAKDDASALDPADAVPPLRGPAAPVRAIRAGGMPTGPAVAAAVSLVPGESDSIVEGHEPALNAEPVVTVGPEPEFAPGLLRRLLRRDSTPLDSEPAASPSSDFDLPELEEAEPGEAAALEEAEPGEAAALEEAEPGEAAALGEAESGEAELGEAAAAALGEAEPGEAEPGEAAAAALGEAEPGEAEPGEAEPGEAAALGEAAAPAKRRWLPDRLFRRGARPNAATAGPDEPPPTDDGEGEALAGRKSWNAEDESADGEGAAPVGAGRKSWNAEDERGGAV